jgi:hypothetical protein
MMMGVKNWVLSIAGVLATSAAMAQVVPVTQTPPVDVAITYDALRTNHITSQSFWMQGGAVEVGARMFRGLGVAARVDGDHAGTNTTSGVPLNLVTAVFGLRYKIESHGGRYAVFGEGLAGQSIGFHSLFSLGSGPVGSANAGTTSTSNALAVEAGGCLDVRLTHRWGIRAFHARYLRTEFPNTTTNVQNSFNIGAGVMLRLGK